MLGGGRKSSVKLTKNQPFSLVSIFFCFLLLSRTFGRHYSRHRTSHHYLHHNQTLQQPYVVVAPPLPLSLFSAKIFFPLRHHDSNSSSDHPFQRLPPLPAVVEAATLSSSAPTTSDRSTDRDSSSKCKSSSSNPGGSTLHRCHRLHHVVLFGQTTLTPCNFPLPLPPPFLHHHCPLREQ